MKEYELVGYWNGSVEHPEISFEVPKDVENKKLVLISLKVLDNSEQDRLESNIKKTLKKIKKEFRNVCDISRRIK